MASESGLRIATWNIHGGVGGDGRFDVGRIGAVLAELDADVVALQEVEHRVVGARDLLDELAHAGAYEAIAGPTLRREGRHYGNALLTRLPVSEQRRVDLSIPGLEPRGALDAVLGAGPRRLRVLATHLGLRPKERRLQITTLLTHLEATPAVTPTVLMGDLNEWLAWGRPLRWLRRWFEPAPAPRTFPAPAPVFALDRIWARPRSALREVGCHRSPTARRASDHLPVSAWLALGAAATRRPAGPRPGPPRP